MSIRMRLMAGFASMGLILVIVVLLAERSVGSVQERMDNVVTLRVPTTETLTNLEIHVYATLSALRGWMLTENPLFKRERVSAWSRIEDHVAALEARAADGVPAGSPRQWAIFKRNLAELRATQDEIEALAHTVDALPARKLLNEEVAPIDAMIFRAISGMIDAEKRLLATPARKELLGIMADIRGAGAQGFAALRTFVLTGEPVYYDSYRALEATRQERMVALDARRALFDDEQARLYQRLAEAIDTFRAYPDRLQRIRVSTRWNLAQARLSDEAIPRAERLISFLGGARQSDGTRDESGALDAQFARLTVEATSVDERLQSLTSTIWALLFLGLGLATVVVTWVSRSITRPLAELGHVAGGLARGDTALEVPGTERSDELGEMARTMALLTARLHEIAGLCERVSGGDYGGCGSFGTTETRVIAGS